MSLYDFRQSLAQGGRWGSSATGDLLGVGIDDLINTDSNVDLLKDVDVNNKIIDKVVDEQNKRVNEASPGYNQRRKQSIESKEEKKQRDKQKLQALTLGDTFCDSLFDVRTNFVEYNLFQLQEQLMVLATATKDKRPRLDMSVLKDVDPETFNRIPSDLLLPSEKSAMKRTVKVTYLHAVDNMPRISIGVLCSVQGGKLDLKAKNVPSEDINSQYYLKSVMIVVQTLSNVATPAVRIDLEIDSATGSEEVHWVRLNKPSDFVVMNFVLPEEKPRVFADSEAHIRYIHEELEKLKEERLRFEHRVQLQMDKLNKILREGLEEKLKSYGFAETTNKVVACLMQSFDEKTGKLDKNKQTECLKEVIRSSDFYKKLYELKQLRKQPSAGSGTAAFSTQDTDREWIDNLPEIDTIDDSTDRAQILGAAFQTLNKLLK